MIEKMTFDMSGLINSSSNNSEIEFWGHDAGEFVAKETEIVSEEVEKQQNKE
jgi:hypothetical protein